MEIEILQNDRMAQDGHSILRSLQNDELHALDLLVREFTQNSLDAAINKEAGIKLEVDTGEFNKSKFLKEINGFNNDLDNVISEDNYKYLSLTDKMTEGLTGELIFENIDTDRLGNLTKLVYLLGANQEKEGAGGSWGLGKTVYFRIGIGIVIYYTRVKNENGRFEERLVANMVEDQKTNKEFLLPKGRGIAFWGEKYNGDKTKPITDANYIKDFLNMFALSPFHGEETGTRIIIPFINDEKLMSNLEGKTKLIFDDGEYSIESYLTNSFKRWYFAKLDNHQDKVENPIQLFINNEELKIDSFENIYKVLQDLYNIGVENFTLKDHKTKGPLTNLDINIRRIDIKPQSKVVKAGNLVYTTVSKNFIDKKFIKSYRELLGFYNDKEAEEQNVESKDLLFTFLRRPGMAIRYEDFGEWTKNIELQSKDERLIAVFIPNSSELLNDNEKELEVKTIEDYLRKCERADHSEWNDITLSNTQLNVVKRIKNQVNTYLKKELSNQIFKGSISNSTLGRVIGSRILPSMVSGKSPIRREPGGRSNTNLTNTSAKLNFHITQLIQDGDDLIAKFKLVPNSNKEVIYNIEISLAIESEDGSVDYKVWENEFETVFPFEMIDIDLNVTSDLNEQNLYSEKFKTLYGYRLNTLIAEETEGKLRIRYRDRSFRPAIDFKGNKVS